MESLRNKSVHELRIMAQAFGVKDIFEKDALHLSQEIELKQQQLIPPIIPPIPKPNYDARLMATHPARRSTATDVTELLAEHIKRGLKLSFEEEIWSMHSGKKDDTGSLRMPLRHILACANRVMQ